MDTKICQTCNTEKNLREFSLKKAAKDGVQTHCKICIHNMYTANARELFEYKGGKCAHCGLRDLDRPEIYDYHHTDPSTKLYNVASMLGYVTEKLHAEADKCILLCVNCHRSEHERLRKELKTNEQKEEQQPPEQPTQHGQTFQYMLC